MEESDGIEEALGAAVRTAVTVATQLAQQVARAREERLRQVQAVSEQAAREMQSRVAAERAAALAQLAPLDRDEWWQRLDQHQLLGAYEVAHAWENVDEVAHRHAERLRAEISNRYGVNPLDPGADPAAVRAELARRVEAERVQAAVILADAGVEIDRAQLGEGQAGGVLEEAGQAASAGQRAALQQRAADLQVAAVGDRGAAAVDLAAGAGIEWDEGRVELAARLPAMPGIGNDLVDARVTADKGNAQPVRDAVTSSTRGASPRARAGTHSGHTETYERVSRPKVYPTLERDC